MVEFPPGEEQRTCAICREPFAKYPPDIASRYANLVCRRCDEKAVTEDGEEPTVGPHTEQGDHLVYIDGIKCWRRIRFGTSLHDATSMTATGSTSSRESTEMRLSSRYA